MRKVASRGFSVPLPWSVAVKACSFLSLTLLLGFLVTLLLFRGVRIPVGSSMGLTVLTDVHGRPYLIVDRPRATSLMVGVNTAQANVEVYTGSVRF